MRDILTSRRHPGNPQKKKVQTVILRVTRIISTRWDGAVPDPVLKPALPNGDVLREHPIRICTQATVDTRSTSYMMDALTDHSSTDTDTDKQRMCRNYHASPLIKKLTIINRNQASRQMDTA